MNSPSRLILSFLISVAGVASAGPTYSPIGINTNGNPRGYWEFLPSAYATNPTKTFPLVIFLHGLGEGGAGTVGSALNAVNRNEVAKSLANPGHSIRALLDQREVIVLCPQTTSNTWWKVGHIRPFLDYALANYRVDPTRIYFTGLSAGSSGVQDFLNKDEGRGQVTAAAVCAYRGEIDSGEAERLAKTMPFWILTGADDFSSKPQEKMDLLAAALAGGTAPPVMSSYPGNTSTYTASFDPLTNWTWTAGIVGNDGVNPKLTVFPNGTGHASWDETYNSAVMWNWLLAQRKPAVAITAPGSEAVVQSGAAVTFQATAQDMNGNSLTGSRVQWESNLDGVLGSGESLVVAELSVGRHLITCLAVDGKYRGNSTQIAVTVPRIGAFTTRFDLGSGDSGYPTTDAGWNNLSDARVGYPGSVVTNAVDESGVATGIRAEVVSPFTGTNTVGMTTPLLYPLTAQADTFYVQNNRLLPGSIQFSGLNPSQTYDFTFFASRNGSGDRTSVYTINGESASLDAAFNTSVTASLHDVVPDGAGRVTLSVDNGPAAVYSYLGVMTIETTGPPPEALPIWRTMHGLAEDGSDDLANPSGDSVVNLLKFAFNMAPMPGDLLIPNGGVLAVDGSSGLPRVDREGDGTATLTWVWRKDPEASVLRYEVLVSDVLSGEWVPAEGTPVITPIDEDWVRMQLTDSQPNPANGRRFYKVRVVTD